MARRTAKSEKSELIITMDTLNYIAKKFDLQIGSTSRFDLAGGRGKDGLAELWGELGYKLGAEVGVESGRYSRTICALNPDAKLYCVDSWAVYPGYRDHVSQEHLNTLYH